MEEEEEPFADTTSLLLFPAFLQSKPPQIASTETNSTTAHWLQNSSFTTDLSVVNDAVSKYEIPYDALVDEERVSEEIDVKKRRDQYEMVASSASDEDASEGEGRKKRKRREASGEARSSTYGYPFALSSSSRIPGVRKWAASTATSGEKEYFFDSRGDRDSLAFGSAYRMDVAHYKLYNSKEVSESSNFLRYTGVGGVDIDEDIDCLDTKLRSGGRYWSAKYAAVERHKNLKRLRILVPTKPVGGLVTDFIPLSSDEDSDSAPVLNVTVVEESWEDEVLRKTKEFDIMTREHPQDESVWLAFAEFQDKVAKMQLHKGARLQTLEKKISILKKATEFNPDSEDLLLSLLNAYQTRDSSDVLIRTQEVGRDTNI